MNKFKTRQLMPLLALAIACAPQVAAAAGAWPTKSVRMVNPFTPGGGVDIVGRAIAQQLHELWGQPVIVDNRPGAGTTIGMEIVANAMPDGHTLLINNGSVATAGALYRNLKFDPVRDLAPIALTIQSPYLLVVHPSVKAGTLPELMALAKSRAGQMPYGSTGTGSFVHLTMELLKSQTRTPLLHVPYKGGAPNMTAVLSGEVHTIFAPVASVTPHVKAGRLRAVGITSAKRVELAPDIPTVAEQGVPGFESVSWYPLFAPARTPADIVKKISGDINQILQKPDVRSRFLAMGMVPFIGPPQALRDYLDLEIKRWGKVIADAGIKPE